MAAAFKKKQCRSCTYDIVTGGLEEDMTTREGFFSCLLMGLRLVAFFSLVMAGPPCSMYVFFSSSQHLRHLYGPRGNPRDATTQLANQIVDNFVLWLLLIGSLFSQQLFGLFGGFRKGL